MSFMDVPFLPVRPGSPVAGMLAATSIQPERMWRLTSDFLLAFFAEHLDGFGATPPTDTPAPTNQRYPPRPPMTGAAPAVIDHPSSFTSAQPVHRAGRAFVRPPGGDAVTGVSKRCANRQADGYRRRGPAEHDCRLARLPGPG